MHNLKCPRKKRGRQSVLPSRKENIKLLFDAIEYSKICSKVWNPTDLPGFFPFRLDQMKTAALGSYADSVFVPRNQEYCQSVPAHMAQKKGNGSRAHFLC